MEWQLILALTIAIAVILVPALLVWYLNIGGMYAAAREGVRIRLFATAGRAIGITLAIAIPAGVYAFLIWFFLGQFGWQAALAVALVLPIVLVVPVLIWAAVVSGLYQVARGALRRRATAPRRRVAPVAETAYER